jgi:hypothetical protein
MYRNLVFSRDQQPNINTISFSDEGVIPIKPVLNHHAVVSIIHLFFYRLRIVRETPLLNYICFMLLNCHDACMHVHILQGPRVA